LSLAPKLRTGAASSSSTDQVQGHSHGGALSIPADARTISTYLLEFGCTMHSVIVGISLGIESDKFTVLLVALVFHQAFEGFALGARFAELQLRGWSEISLATIYCLSAPIGMVIGIATASSYNPKSERALYTTGFMDATSSGILLYVGFNMVLLLHVSSLLRLFSPGFWSGSSLGNVLSPCASYSMNVD
jgi:zinc transporter ZupT